MKEELSLSPHFKIYINRAHGLEKEMATHSSVLAWRIPETEEPGRRPSMGSHRVGHDWSDLAAAAAAGLTDIYFINSMIILFLLLKLFQLWPLGTPLVWLLCSFSNILPLLSLKKNKNTFFFLNYLAHLKIFQPPLSHLSPVTDLFSKDPWFLLLKNHT